MAKRNKVPPAPAGPPRAKRTAAPAQNTVRPIDAKLSQSQPFSWRDRTDLRRAAINGDFTWARFVAPDAGGAMVGYESNWADIELPAAEFDAYLSEEGLDGPLRERARRGRVGGFFRGLRRGLRVGFFRRLDALVGGVLA